MWKYSKYMLIFKIWILANRVPRFKTLNATQADEPTIAKTGLNT